jgi:hypothetical protein
MSESTGVILRTDEADTEVELSAQDLLALSDSPHFGERKSGLTSQPSRPAASALPRKIDAPKASSRYVSASRLSLSLVITIGVFGAAAYVLTRSNGANEPTTANTSEPAPQLELSAPEQIAEGEPVRFANPFDAGEVFEFPPGTSETEAREAVAEVLMERAMSRQKT